MPDKLEAWPFVRRQSLQHAACGNEPFLVGGSVEIADRNAIYGTGRVMYELAVSHINADMINLAGRADAEEQQVAFLQIALAHIYALLALRG